MAMWLVPPPALAIFRLEMWTAYGWLAIILQADVRFGEVDDPRSYDDGNPTGLMALQPSSRFRLGQRRTPLHFQLLLCLQKSDSLSLVGLRAGRFFG